MRSRTLRAGLALAALLAVGFAAASCSALSHEEVAARLAALPGNTALAARGVERATVTTPDGGTLALGWLHVPADEDAPDTPPLVLVHGTPGSLYDWAPLFEVPGGLAGRRDTWLVEVPGHGATPLHEEPLTFQRAADAVAATLDRLGLRDVDLVGHSYGGGFAWRVALDRPDLVGRLVLVDSAGAPRHDDEWLPEEVAMREWPGAGLGWLLNSRERIATALRPHFTTLPPDLVEEVFTVCDNPANWRAMVDLARDEDGARFDELGRLTQPTLLLWGARDVAYPPERFARAFEQRIPDARLVVLPDTGHYPQRERPGSTAAALREFLAVD